MEDPRKNATATTPTAEPTSTPKLTKPFILCARAAECKNFGNYDFCGTCLGNESRPADVEAKGSYFEIQEGKKTGNW